MAGVTKVQIDYKPRDLQRKVHDLRQKHRFVVLVCHRRFGKTVLAVNELQKSALTTRHPRPRTALIGPTYRQEKAAAWDYMQYYSRPIPSVAANQSELRIDYPNGGQTRIYGADNPDALRGIYLDDVAMDEYGMHPPKTFSEVIGPTLVDRGGKALFLGTPNGKNQFYEVAQFAKERQAAGDPEWVFVEFPASVTKVIPENELATAKARMTSDEYAQEFECSFEASVKGAIYARELEALRAEGRITRVPFDPVLPVDTDWDIGFGDATAIWFSQSLKTGEVRLIDYYEAEGEALPHYIHVLKSKAQQRGYVYGTHWAPWDFAATSFETGRSRMDAAREHGFTFKQAPRMGSTVNSEVEEGINAARLMLPRCWFDAENCKAGLEALMHYRRDYNMRLNEFKATPVHDWSSHGADAFRGLAARHQTPVERKQVRYDMPQNWSWS